MRPVEARDAERNDLPPIRHDQKFRMRMALVLLPLLVLGVSAVWLIYSDPLRIFATVAPPVERLTIERLVLDDGGIHLNVRAGGSKPMTVAQVQVDDAYWRFTQAPDGPLPRLSSAWVHVPYPWISGDAHVVKLVTNTGATFEHEIEVAVASPISHAGGLRAQVIIGSFVGILPVTIGLMFFPLLQGVGRQGIRFVLALTCGLLFFLLVDMAEDAFELARESAPAFQGSTMVLVIAGMSCLILVTLGRLRGVPEGIMLATFIALGIGFHNFGEGLAIGSALATGAASLGAFLVLGFTIHNVTEGIGIAVPMVRTKPKLIAFVGLALLAGAPAILGIWLGSYAVAPQWAAVALAIGVGAIAQVLFEVGSYVLRGEDGLQWAPDRYLISGFSLGIAFMFLTGMLIKV